MKILSEEEWKKLHPTLKYFRSMQEDNGKSSPYCVLRCSGSNGEVSHIIRCDTEEEANRHLKEGHMTVLWKKAVRWRHPRNPTPGEKRDGIKSGGPFDWQEEKSRRALLEQQKRKSKG